MNSRAVDVARSHLDITGRLKDLLKEAVVDAMQSGTADAAIRRKTLEILLWAFVGLLLLVVEYQMAWDGRRLRTTLTTELLKLAISVSTAVLLLRLTLYYYFLMVVDRKRWRVSRGTLADAVADWRFWAEAVVCAVHPLPWVVRAGAPVTETHVGLLMFLRLYLVVRAVRYHSQIYRRREELTQVTRSLASSEDGGAGDESSVPLDFGYVMSFKTLFHSNAVTMLVSFTCVFIIAMSYTTYIAEREAQEDLRTFEGAAWFTVVSMTTVGYGDLVPDGHLGRFLGVVSAVIGILISSLLVAVITNKLILTHHEQLAANTLEHDRLLRMHRDTAARFLQIMWRCNRMPEGAWSSMTAKQRQRFLTTHHIRTVNLITRLRKLRQLRAAHEGSAFDPVADRLGMVGADVALLAVENTELRTEVRALRGELGLLGGQLDAVLARLGASPEERRRVSQGHGLGAIAEQQPGGGGAGGGGVRREQVRPVSGGAAPPRELMHSTANSPAISVAGGSDDDDGGGGGGGGVQSE